MNINNKKIKLLFFIFLIFSFILTTVHTFIQQYYAGNNFEKTALENAIKKSKEKEKIFRSFLDNSSQTLFAIRRLTLFDKYLESGQNKELLEDIFLSYTKSHNRLMQLRFINKNGFEEIRVDRNHEFDSPYIVSKNILQKKADRYYFYNSKEKNKEQVWFSALDLNIENSKVEVPYKPTLRAILPIVKDDKFLGILIINYFMKEFLDNFVKESLYDISIYNKDGFTLNHTDKNKSWGYYKEDKFNISKEYVDYKKILNKRVYKTDEFVSRKLNLPIYNELIILLKIKKDFIEEKSTQLQKEYLFIGIIIFLLSLFLTYLVVKIISKTLLNFEEIKELNEKLEEASKIASLGFWEKSYNSEEVIITSAISDILELNNKKKISRKEFLELLEDVEKQKLFKAIKESIEEKKEYFITYKIKTKKGNIRYIEERGKHYLDDKNNLVKSYGSINDITKKYFSLEKYRILLELASDGIFFMDTNGKLLEFSHKSCDLLGYTLEEMKSKKVYDWDKNLSESEFKNIVSKLTDKSTVLERVHTRKDSSTYIAQITTKKIAIQNNTYIYSSVRDISDIKNNEKKILSQKNKLEAIFETALEGIAILDLNNKYINVNKNYCDILEYQPEELLGKTSFELISPEYLEQSKDVFANVLKEGVYKGFEREYITKSGKIKILKSSIVLMPDKKTFLMTTVDNTQLRAKERKIEEQKRMLVVQSKMSSISELLTNISHHWRQPLSMISTAVSGLKLKQDFDIIKDSDIEEVTSLVIENTKKLSKTIDDVRDFMEGNYSYTHYNVDSLIDEFFDLENNRFRDNNINIIKDIEHGIEIYNSKDGLLQVLLNIFNNSIEALDSIEERKFIFFDVRKENSDLIIKIKDNAGGIEEDNITKIFDPYYTTHHQSFGKGMGLNIVYNVVTKSLNGKISVKNIDFEIADIEYKGAEFEIVIPLNIS